MSAANSVEPDHNDIAYVAVPSSTVVAAGLGSGTALLDLRTNQYFSLDEVGTLIWQSLQQPRSRAALVQGVTEAYEIDAESCARDVDLLLGDLVDAALVEVRPGQSS